MADYFDVSVDYLFGRSEIKTLIKNSGMMKEIQNFLSRINSFNTLDISKNSAYIKCAVVEFYAYLLKKDGKCK